VLESQGGLEEAGDGRQPGVAVRVEVEDGPHGVRLVASEADALTVTDVREVPERERR
jgi:hypothetical protein